MRRTGAITLLVLCGGCSTHDSGPVVAGGEGRADFIGPGNAWEGAVFMSVEDLRDRMVQGQREGCSPWSYFDRFHELEDNAYCAMDEKYADHAGYVGACLPGVGDPEVCSEVEFTAGRELLELVRSQGGWELLREAQSCPQLVPLFSEGMALIDPGPLRDALSVVTTRVSSLHVALEEHDDAEVDAAFNESLFCADAVSWLPTVLARRVHLANEESLFRAVRRALERDRLPEGMAGRRLERAKIPGRGRCRVQAGRIDRAIEFPMDEKGARSWCGSRRGASSWTTRRWHASSAGHPASAAVSSRS